MKTKETMKTTKDTFTKLERTILMYSENEKRYMMELDKRTKEDLILMLNNINNIRKLTK